MKALNSNLKIRPHDRIIRIGYPITEANPEGYPLPTQHKFHASNKKYRLLAGGFATGKTTSLVIEVCIQLLKYPNNYGVLGRKDLSELRSTTLKELLDLLPKQLIKSHNKTEKVIKLTNGSELYYMNLDDNRDAVEKIKSLNLGFVAIDQMEEISEDIFLAFQGRLRRPYSARCLFGTCNPAGHDWLYKRFKSKESVPEITRKHYEVFEATTLENIYLPPDYVKELLNYPEQWVRRFVFCDWSDFAGLVYREFNETLDTEDYYEPQPTDEFMIVLDYGIRNPTAVLFIAVDYDGIIHIYDEIYWTDKLIIETADEIKKRQYFKKSICLIDPSAFNKQRDLKSVADEFADYGIVFMPASNELRQGIERVNKFFRDRQIKISKSCTNTIKEITNYKWKDIKIGTEKETPIKKNDHTCDCIRYMANYILVPELPKASRVISEREEASMMSEEKPKGKAYSVWADYE